MSVLPPACLASFVINTLDQSIQTIDDHGQYQIVDQENKSCIQLDRVENTIHFNPFSSARGLSPDWTLIYDTLLTPDSRQFGIYHSLIATEIKLSNDKMTLVITLHPDALFENGDTITADDVIASISHLIHHGAIQYHYLAERTYQLKRRSMRQLAIKSNQPFTTQHIIQLGTLPITQKSSLVNNRNPVSSGAYQVSNHKLKRFAILTQQPHYWAKRLAIRNQVFQFNQIKLIYLKNRHTAFELFRRGEVDFRWEEFHENWQILQRIRQRNRSLNLKEVKQSRPAGMSGLAFNQKSKPLKQLSVRKALTHAFHFEEINQSLFRNQYHRIESYFTNTPFASQTKPNLRFSLEDADQLLIQSNWIYKNGIRRHKFTQEPLSIRILVNSIANEKIANIYAKNLKFLGIKSYIERANSADYLHRLEHGNFDVAYYTITTNPYTDSDLLASFKYQKNRHYNFARLFHLQNTDIHHELQMIKNTDKIDESTMQKIDKQLMDNYLFIPFWRPSVDRIAHWRTIDGPNESFTARPKDFYRWWWSTYQDV